MADEILALPSPKDDYVTLSGDTAEGRMLRKKILPINKSFIHPGDHSTKIFVDKAMAQSLVDNFKKGVCEVVQVPIVNQQNQHSEDPRDNAGRVTGLDYDDNGVYATIKASKYAQDFGKTILGASAFLHLNYIDTATGARVGPTLLHVAATNRPHVNGLGEYEDLVKASADISKEQPILFLTEDETTSSVEKPIETAITKPVEKVQPETTPEEEETPMTKEEALAFLKENPGVAQEFLKTHDNIDVEALQGDATKVAELSAQLKDVNAKLELSGTQLEDVEDLAKSYLSLSESNKSLIADVENLKLSNATYAKRDAENEVDKLVRTGYLPPVQRDAMVELSLSNREMFDKLVPDSPVVKLSESGATVHEETDNKKYAEDIQRYKDMAVKLSRKN